MKLINARDFKDDNKLHDLIASYFLNMRNNTIKKFQNILAFVVAMILISPSLSLNNIIILALLVFLYFYQNSFFCIKYSRIFLSVKRKEYSFNEVMIEKVEPKKWFSAFYKIILKDKDGNVLTHPIKIGLPRMYKLKNHMFTSLYLIQLNTNKQYELLLI